MNLTLIRTTSDADSTLGELLINGVRVCYTVEDEYRAKKQMHETRIPAGTYEIKLRTVGGFHNKFLAKFGPNFHRGMLWLQDVPGFEFILIHTGNTDDDSSGCIIVGTSRVKNNSGGGTVSRSVEAYQNVYPGVRDALLRGEKVTITIEDRDR